VFRAVVALQLHNAFEKDMRTRDAGLAEAGELILGGRRGISQMRGKLKKPWPQAAKTPFRRQNKSLSTLMRSGYVKMALVGRSPKLLRSSLELRRDGLGGQHLIDGSSQNGSDRHGRDFRGAWFLRNSNPAMLTERFERCGSVRVHSRQDHRHTGVSADG